MYVIIWTLVSIWTCFFLCLYCPYSVQFGLYFPKFLLSGKLCLRRKFRFTKFWEFIGSTPLQHFQTLPSCSSLCTHLEISLPLLLLISHWSPLLFSKYLSAVLGSSFFSDTCCLSSISSYTDTDTKLVVSSYLLVFWILNFTRNLFHVSYVVAMIWGYCGYYCFAILHALPVFMRRFKLHCLHHHLPRVFNMHIFVGR